jgi:hypothetical protein
MADYFSPTVVQPSIPITDMTPLERLLLGLIFDAEPDGEDLYLHAEFGPSDIVGLPIDHLRAAFEASAAVPSRVASHVAEQLARTPEDETEIEIDLTDPSWEIMLQDIVRRSTCLRSITVISSFTCSKMRPDGFGGVVALITADRIFRKSTGDLLAEFLAEAGLDGRDGPAAR